MGQKNNLGAIPYSLGVRLSNPSDKNSEKRVYAYAQSKTIGTLQLAEHMHQHTSSFSVGEVRGIITDMVSCIVELLADGYAVSLEGLGKLFVTLCSEGAEKPEDFTASLISRVNIRFAADTAMLGSLNAKARFELVNGRKEQAESLKAEKEAMNASITGENTGGNSGTGDDNDVTD